MRKLCELKIVKSTLFFHIRGSRSNVERTCVNRPIWKTNTAYVYKSTAQYHTHKSPVFELFDISIDKK